MALLLVLLLHVCICLRQAVAYIPPHQPHLVQAMLRWTAATMWAVKSMVRPKSDLQKELQGEHPMLRLSRMVLYWRVPYRNVLCRIALYRTALEASARLVRNHTKPWRSDELLWVVMCC
jgi:hypothetical protein